MRWRERSDNQLHLLVVRLSALGVVLLAIFVGAFIWRSLTFRYVQDLRRRRQLLQLRKLTVALVVGLVLLFDFASQLGTLATVMGLAAAGVALALQNVILSSPATSSSPAATESGSATASRFPALAVT